MDAVDAGGLLLSAAGVAISLWALFEADSAKKAVDKVIGKNSDQIARDEARELLDKLRAARDAAIGRMQGATSLSSAGRHISADKRALELAQDALATATFASDQILTSSMRKAAYQITAALEKITSKSGLDGWKVARDVLQNVIPKIELWQRELGAKIMR